MSLPITPLLRSAALLLGFLACGAFLCAAQPPSAASDDSLFQQAMSAMQSGSFARARSILIGLRARHPHDFPVDESLGLACAQLGDLKSALLSFQQAAQDDPGSAVGQANLGTAYLKLHQNALAVHALEASLRLDPSNASTQAALAQAYMLLHQPQKAVPAFQAALKLNPEDSGLLYNTALAEFQAGNAAQAEPLLARMPGLENSAEAQSLYGDVDESLGKYEDAAKYYANAARLDPSESNVFMLGIEFLRHWTFDPAIKEFEAGVQRFPKSTRMQVGLGVAYYGGSYYDKAIPVFAALLKKSPDNALYAELLGRDCTVLTEGIRPECASLVTFAERHPGNAIIATYAATSILHQPQSQQQLDTARSLLAHALRANPRMPQAQFAMGLLLQQEKQWSESIPRLETAIQLKPDYATAHYRLALAYNHNGDKQKAQEQIALELKYSKADRAEVENRLRSVTTFLVKMQ
jgi:tetratricopeptide (TPR) repeat protein